MLRPAALTVVLVILVSLVSLSPSRAAAAPGGCDRWVYMAALDLPPGFWEAGTHTYGVRVAFGDSVTTTLRAFSVDMAADRHRGEVFLRIPGVFSFDGPITTIHPSQDTVFHAIFDSPPDSPLTREEQVARRAITTVEFSVDGINWIVTELGAVVILCSWFNPGLGRSFRDYQPDY